jgi:hypothetical protein
MPGDAMPITPLQVDHSPGDFAIPTRGRSSAVSAGDLPVDSYKCMLWCPSVDNDIKDIAKQALKKLSDMYPRLLEGGKKELSQFEPTQKLYIVAHGDPRMPIFRTDKTFSATDLADLLVKDGLSLDQKEIELLVCHAGESVNTEKRSNYLMKMRNKILETRNVNPDAASRLSNRVQSETRNEKKPEFYDAEHSSGRELPLGAQLVQALKSHNFTNLVITCYQAPITSTFNNGVVCLDLKGKTDVAGKPMNESDVPVTSPEGGRRRVLWRACK